MRPHQPENPPGRPRARRISPSFHSIRCEITLISRLAVGALAVKIFAWNCSIFRIIRSFCRDSVCLNPQPFLNYFFDTVGWLMRQAVMPDCRWLAGYCGVDIFLPAMQLAAMTASRNFFGLEYAKIGNKSAPIQLALHRFRELAICNINIFFKYILKTGRERD